MTDHDERERLAAWMENFFTVWPPGGLSSGAMENFRAIAALLRAGALLSQERELARYDATKGGPM